MCIRDSNEIVDAVYLTAHDKFQDIINEAQKGDSIFKAGNVIRVEDIEENISTTQMTFDFGSHVIREEAYSYGVANTKKTNEIIDTAVNFVQEEIAKEIHSTKTVEISKEQKNKIFKKVAERIKEDKDLSEVFKENENPFYHWLNNTVEETHQTAKEKFIPIPKLKITDEGVVAVSYTHLTLPTKLEV